MPLCTGYFSLFFWSYMLDFMRFRFPVIHRSIAASRLCLVRDGKLVRRNLRREFIIDEDLNAKIQREGVETSPPSSTYISKRTAK